MVGFLPKCLNELINRFGDNSEIIQVVRDCKLIYNVAQR
jgi:hypothetical protein